MVEFFFSHRELALTLAFSGIVALPIIVGYGVGHIPKRLAFSLLASILLFSTLSIFINANLSGSQPTVTRFSMSIVFGLFWIVASWRAYQPVSEKKDHLLFLKKIRWMFLCFGVTWIVLTIYQYVLQK